MSVSIVVPMYNLERYVAPLLDSLLDQSEKRFEVIMVDDGSTDRTYEVAEAILARHPILRAQLIRTANAGVSAARNTGLQRPAATMCCSWTGMIISPADWCRALKPIPGAPLRIFSAGGTVWSAKTSPPL